MRLGMKVMLLEGTTSLYVCTSYCNRIKHRQGSRTNLPRGSDTVTTSTLV